MQPIKRPYKGPAVPTAYEANWSLYTNLTPAQEAWFQSQPVDLAKYAKTQQQLVGTAPLVHSSGITVHGMVDGTGTVSSLRMSLAVGKDISAVASTDVAAAHAAFVARWKATQAVEATAITGINAKPPTVTSRAQIDAALTAAVTPAAI